MDQLPDKSSLPTLDLDLELFARNNISVAFLVIIAGLIRNIEQRTEILESVKPDYINVPFNRFLYEVIADELSRNEELDVISIINRIPDFGPLIYGSPTTSNGLKAHYFTLAQVLDFCPTASQVYKAIDMIVGYARVRGLLS